MWSLETPSIRRFSDSGVFHMISGRKSGTFSTLKYLTIDNMFDFLHRVHDVNDINTESQAAPTDPSVRAVPTLKQEFMENLNIVVFPPSCTV